MLQSPPQAKPLDTDGQYLYGKERCVPHVNLLMLHWPGQVYAAELAPLRKDIRPDMRIQQVLTASRLLTLGQKSASQLAGACYLTAPCSILSPSRMVCQLQTSAISIHSHALVVQVGTGTAHCSPL